MTKERKTLLKCLLKQYLMQSRVKNGKYFIALENGTTVDINFSVSQDENIKFSLAIKYNGKISTSSFGKYITGLPIDIMDIVQTTFRKYRISYGITKYGMGNPAVSTIESIGTSTEAANQVYRIIDTKLELFSKTINAKSRQK